MKKVVAFIRTNRLEAVQQALEDVGVVGMSVEQIKGYGRQQGQSAQFSGSTYALNLVPKLRLVVVVRDDQVESVIEAVCESAQTGELGDGKIFVSDVVEAIRIRTGERGEDALG